MDIFPGGKTLLNFKGRFPGMWGEASRWSCGLRALLGCCDSCDGLNGQLRCISCRFPNLTASFFHLFQCQFVAIATHSSYKLFTKCPFPDGFNIAVILCILSLLALFLCFYYQTYVRGKREKLTWRKSKRTESAAWWIWAFSAAGDMVPGRKCIWGVCMRLTSSL